MVENEFPQVHILSILRDEQWAAPSTVVGNLAMENNTK